MADSPNGDFYSLALSSLAHQISLASQNDAPSVSQRRINNFDPQEYAKCLVERDVPKIDSAVKSYLSLVAARSVVASEIDVISVQCRDVSRADGDRQAKHQVQCVFVSSTTAVDANRSSLLCARTLLLGINSTVLPDLKETSNNSSQGHQNERDEVDFQQKQDAIRIIWNGLVNNPSCTADLKTKLKPTKLLGKNALIVAYPFIQERFRRGIAVAQQADKKNDEKTNDIHAHENTSQSEVVEQDPLHSIPDKFLPPILPPKDIHITQWEAYYTEFGNLLIQACRSQHDDRVQSDSTLEDDSALIWSNDGGVKELQARRERRTRRAENALAVEGQDGGDAASG
ncbi:hypothetical protein HJC23_002153 [Cyclotella cryptica]|uniref:Uncharacterized protein n=1 Tax=Cyclotella cryptica TaxID=29204 RepID=A0ABD3Q655_9STRA|eukprot:CCRYP_008163-RA/>CCRYP_008163-RA protein AED:0.00 eAED:0.00 QI:14/-1/1/1/-1/1/1/96/341